MKMNVKEIKITVSSRTRQKTLARDSTLNMQTDLPAPKAARFDGLLDAYATARQGQEDRTGQKDRKTTNHTNKQKNSKLNMEGEGNGKRKSYQWFG